MTLSFDVPGKPIGVNAAYKRGVITKGSRGFYLSQDARSFKERLRAYALIAARSAGWKIPPDKARLAVAITVWNAKRLDVESPQKLILDAMQDVIYRNDRQVDQVSIARGADDGPVRVSVTVALLEAPPAASAPAV